MSSALRLIRRPGGPQCVSPGALPYRALRLHCWRPARALRAQKPHHPTLATHALLTLLRQPCSLHPTLPCTACSLLRGGACHGPPPLRSSLTQVLQADGGTRCACINAATLALADAGVPMRDMVASCAAGFLDGTPLLDLNYVEDSAMGPDLSLAIHPSLDKVVLLQVRKGCVSVCVFVCLCARVPFPTEAPSALPISSAPAIASCPTAADSQHSTAQHHNRDVTGHAVCWRRTKTQLPEPLCSSAAAVRPCRPQRLSLLMTANASVPCACLTRRWTAGYPWTHLRR